VGIDPSFPIVHSLYHQEESVETIELVDPPRDIQLLGVLLGSADDHKGSLRYME